MRVSNLFIMLMIMTGSQVFAEESQLTGYDEDSVPEHEVADEASAEWRFLAGTGPAWLPHYEGASSYGTRAVPLLQASKGNFFAGTLGGIGYYLQKSLGMSYGVRLGAAPGRLESADIHLAGMGDMKPAGELGFFIKGKRDQIYWLAKLSAGSRGSRAELGAGCDFKAGMKDVYRLGVTVNVANQSWMQAYFGVTPEQSASSGLAVYDAAGGVRSYGVVAGWSHIYDRNWLGNLALSGKQLSRGVSGSPVVQSSSTYALSYVVMYQF